MEYRKLLVGPSAEHTNLAIDDKLKLIAVATMDGSVKIYCPINETVTKLEIGIVADLQFVKGTGSLIAFEDGNKFHVMEPDNLGDASRYRHYSAQLDIGSSVSCIHICQRLASAFTGTTLIPLLIAHSDSCIELILLYNSTLIRTAQTVIWGTSTDKRICKVLRMSETDYRDDKLTVMFLVDGGLQLVKFTCQWIDKLNIPSVTFDLDCVICSFVCGEEINNFSVISEKSFLVTTNKGKYSKIKYNEDCNNLYIESTVFPYGPFPCKDIKNCKPSIVSGFNGDCFIFSGGLPAVTYKSLNTLSVSLNDDPEICFTFDASIIDFDIIPHKTSNKESDTSTGDEIVVLTKWQVVSIVNQGGTWKSSNIYHFSPMSRGKILAISNTIEVTLEDGGYDSVSNAGELEDTGASVRLFTTADNDSTITVWCWANDCITEHSKIQLAPFLRKDIIEEKKVLWPRFQKCGLWNKANSNEEIKINSLKLMSNNMESFCLFFSIERLIFHFTICFKRKDNDSTHDINTVTCRRHISLNGEDGDCQTTNSDQIIEEVNGIPSCFELKTIISLSDNIDIDDISFNDSIIMFGGFNGVGLLDVISGKYFYISSEDLSLVDSGKSKSLLSDFLLNRFKKRKSFESSSLKIYPESRSSKVNSIGTVVNVTSFHLFAEMKGQYNLIIGLNNGLIMILCLSLDKNNDIIVSSSYRRIPSRSKDPILSLSVISNIIEDWSPNFRTSRTSHRSVDSTQGSSLSTESKSTHQSNDSCQKNDDAVVSTTKTRAMSLRWPSIKKVQPNDLILLRCDKKSIKVIDYLKLKTRFKYKIKEQIKKSENSADKTQTTTIVQVRIVRGNHFVNDCLMVFCTDGSIMKFSVPNLLPLFSVDIQAHVADTSLLSINDDIILIPRNISINDNNISELIVLDQRQKSIRKYKENSIECQYRTNKNVMTSLSKTEIDQEEMDFMRCAEPSITSLLW